MEPLLDVLEVNAVAGATTWDTPSDKSEKSTRAVRPVEPTPTFVINLPSRFTARQARALARDFRRDLDTDQPSIILDLSEVREMDSAGLEMLVECLKETLSRDGKIQLRGISPEAATILELTGVDAVLNMFSETSPDTIVGVGPLAVMATESSPTQVAA